MNPIIFDVSPSPDFNFVTSFAQHFNIEAQPHFLEFPPELGRGFIRRICFGDGLVMLVHHYQLKYPFLLRRLSSEDYSDNFIFRFCDHAVPQRNRLSIVQTLASNISTEDLFPKETAIHYIIIGIKKPVLLSMLDVAENHELDFFFKNLHGPFLYQESMTAEMKRILDTIVQKANSTHIFENLFYKTKLKELMYLYFVKLFERPAQDFTAFSKREIESALFIEQNILNHLETPPKLPVLSKQVGISSTKMKRLFKQIFGQSIYQYYQIARMNKAAHLLKNDPTLSVSEVGYRLGFSNLSHFSRLFASHIGIKPKAYAKQMKTPAN